MENPAQMQTQAAVPAVVNLAAMKAGERTGTDGNLAMPPASPAETSGLSPEVFQKTAPANPRPKECTTAQLLEIVVDVAHRFRTAKEDLAKHKDYIQRLKNEVFKVSFGSVGAYVPVTYRTDEGVSAAKKMRWNEFCKTQFGVSADWINRVCGGKREGPGQTGKSRRESRDNRHAYEAEKTQMQSQLKVAAENQAALAGRIADLEKENEKLQRSADKIQEQPKKVESKGVASLQAQVEDLKEFAKLAAEAFQIINGNFGQRLMASEEGRCLVEIAKKAVAMKGSRWIC